MSKMIRVPDELVKEIELRIKRWRKEKIEKEIKVLER
jgi:hypothetical protein